ncbi:MAG: hypothetical protein KAV82_02560 [Phycisphaerae bacterium]|nr:hypothetical protein [Phycisphaerae bacterium]
MSTASTTDVNLLHDPRLEQLRQATGKVIGAVFYETLLKSMRNNPLRGPFGHGGHGERVFRGQLDAELAGRMGLSNRNNLTRVLFERLAPQQLRMEHSPKDEPPEMENGKCGRL